MIAGFQSSFYQISTVLTTGPLPALPPLQGYLTWCSREHPEDVDIGPRVSLKSQILHGTGIFTKPFSPLNVAIFHLPSGKLT